MPEFVGEREDARDRSVGTVECDDRQWLMERGEPARFADIDTADLEHQGAVSLDCPPPVPQRRACIPLVTQVHGVGHEMGANLTGSSVSRHSAVGRQVKGRRWLAKFVGEFDCDLPARCGPPQFEGQLDGWMPRRARQAAEGAEQAWFRRWLWQEESGERAPVDV